MTSGGSQQLRRFRIAIRDGATIESAASEAGMGLVEAKLHAADDAKNPPPPEAYVLLGHNQPERPMSDNVSADQLRLFIERIERLEEEKKGIADDIKDAYAEAKATGFDAATMREIVKLRKMEKHHRDERDALLATYRAALGMDYSDTPLGSAAIRTAMERTVAAVNAGALGPNVTAEIRPAAPSVSEDDLYPESLRLVREHQKASTLWLQRQMRLGYNAAARLIERMEREGAVSKPDHVGRREVIAEAAEAA